MARRSGRWLMALDVVAGLAILGAVYMALVYAPDAANLTSENEIKAQHIFYFHMGCNVASAIGLFTSFVASILFLVTRRRIWDSIAVSGVEMGLAFGIGVLASGSVWARPTWNTWWTWDPRLTSAAVTVLVYVAYLMLRGAVEDPGRRARFAGVYGVFAFVSVPITFLSIRLWRTIHPVVFGAANPDSQGSFGMGPNIRLVLMYSMFAFTILAITLLIHRVRLELRREEVEHLKEQLAA
ncbi:MAG: cytochrome c biogenesis protein CcsA [Anaerolineae bacterium]|nr:cytochrome c biogenesis protein CcsA [Anaerolineae bacterium]